MKKLEYNDDVAMLFTVGKDWHVNILLPLDAQIAEIHLRVYSFSFPEFIYNLNWNYSRHFGNHLKIPIDAARIGHSNPEEVVRLAFDITYYSDTAESSH
jgi:hypothetical protein